MGIFDNRKNNKSEPIQENKGKPNDFKQYIKELANNGNLTPEQLKEKYAELIGIPKDILNLPGVRDVLFSLKEFNVVKEGGIWFEQSARKIAKDYSVNQSENRDGSRRCIITYKNGLDDTIFEEDIIEVITRGDFQEIRKEEKQLLVGQNFIERRSYNDGIEMHRGKTTKYPWGEVTTETATRYDEELSKVTRTFNDKSAIIDISLDSMTDIATLDGAFLSEKTRRIYPYNVHENLNKKRERIMKKVEQSKQRSSCLKYLEEEPGQIR